MNSNKMNNAERYYVASQWQLMWHKFRRHKLALPGTLILLILYIIGPLFCEFIAPYDIYRRHEGYIYAPPQRIRFIDKGKFQLRPFVYGIKGTRDPVTRRRIYTPDTNKKHYIQLFIRGDEYKLWNLVPSDLHLFGVKEGTLFLFGTEKLGRDLFSRVLFGARISLTIGLVGVAISFILGCIFGGISGYFGGSIDMIIQRVIEFLMSIPKLPLWMALAAAVPLNWPAIKVYFGIVVVLSIIGWTGLARVVRGKLLGLREDDYAMAAKISGASDWQVIARHLLPSFMSYLIVRLTLAIPGMILGETSLSFLGIGLRAPTVSWGTLLQDAQNVHTLTSHPWLLIPGVFVIITVFAFNFVGDALRDAADPYKQ